MKPRVALDAMGGDGGLSATVQGALAAAHQAEIEILLVGDEARIRAELARIGAAPSAVEVVNASQVVENGEAPVAAVRRKPDASLNVSFRLVAEGRADAVVSAGHSGAALVAGITLMGRFPSVERPALLVTIPAARGEVVLLDVGANVDVTARHLVQFAYLGEAFARLFLGRVRPVVGLVSNGAEPAKGTEQVRGAHAELLTAPFAYAGPVEGQDLFADRVDVAVCDGFVGNVLLKGAEGVVERVLGLMQDVMKEGGSPEGLQQPVGEALRRVRSQLEYAERGGALLAGVEGNVVIAHGRSDARALKNAIRFAARCAENRIALQLKEQVAACSRAAQ